ncbi:Hpt domain-containing protein [Rhodoferax lacus]|uniref:Hpt domain-containing protein n=1 Tax=Rhodoferax lacus TaxID=2184758 RepID=A0A3E1RGY7_9BURK|nr:Hpt domain-containing protein [Rhodoferax lacus]RFO98655.1 Hpt domain-containing protein [Rhodoferax lacus]
MASQLSQTGPVILDIDLALSQIGDVDAMNDMIVMLEEALARDVPQVTTMLQSGDFAGANRLLHALKGFVPIFCHESFCDKVVYVEGLSKVAANPDLVAAYAGLRPHLETLLAEVSAYLAANGISA